MLNFENYFPTFFSSLNNVLGGFSIIGIVSIVIIFICTVMYWRFGQQVIRTPFSEPLVPRFRKREKIQYYVKHFRRKFTDLTEHLKSIKSPEARRMLMVAVVKKILKIPDPLSVTTLKHSRLPESFFEPDEDGDAVFPDDLKLLVETVRVFGHLEKSFFIEFSKFIEHKELSAGDHLFRQGDVDDSVYVVQSGKIQLFIAEENGSRSIISEVTRGRSIDSFLSVLNVLTERPTTHAKMGAVAVEPSRVLKLPTRSFLEVCKPQTTALIRILQMITIRLQRLIAVAVQSQLGMSSDLIRKETVCKLPNAKAQECLRECSASLADDLDQQSSKSSDEAEIFRTSLMANARRSIAPLSSGCVEWNKAGEIVGEFEPELHNLPEGHVGTSGLELGEVSTYSSSTHRPEDTAQQSNSRQPKVSTSSFTSTSQPKRKHSNLIRNTVSVDSTAHWFKPLNMDQESKARLIRAVEEDLVQLLNLPDIDLLRGGITLGTIDRGTHLLSVGDPQKNLYYILSGELRAIQSPTMCGDDTLFVIHPGEVVGLLNLVTGEPSVYSIKVASKSLVASISREHFYSIVRQHPDTLLSVIRLISLRVPAILHELDFAVQWITVEAGKALYKIGEKANDFYVILSGRLRQVENLTNGSYRVVDEYGRGDMLGVLEVLCERERTHTVMAIRDSEVAQIPAFLLHHLENKIPRFSTGIIQLLSDRLLGTLTTNDRSKYLGLSHMGSPYLLNPGAQPPAANTNGPDPRLPQLNKIAMSNLRTIAILPTSSSINADAFALELQHSMRPIGPSVRLTSSIICKRLGSAALLNVNRYRLNAWLSQQEDSHRMVLFVCDYTRSSAWNDLCLRQADCILVLALSRASPFRPSSIELMLESHPTKVMKALVLMYPLSTDYPKHRQAAKWLNARPWISHHYHIRCEPRVFSSRNPEELVAFYDRVLSRERPDPQSDFSRLARYLTGEAIGLVLGGGGARGCAHVGVIRAFLEAGIPIDLVGGTSIGAFMSAAWSVESPRYAQFTQRARTFTACFNSIWNKLKDFTYPVVSVFSGKEFNNQLENVFGDCQIEDLWLPSFYVTSDITNCGLRIHTQGSLWRYVRASMSLSGYLPPLCDPYDGCLLLDGGYVNNVPADVMALLGAKTIFAVDVGASVDTDFTNYGDHLSGWRLLYHKFIKSDSLRVPNLSEIQSRLAYISCVRHLDQVKESGICHYLRPPIDHYLTLQFTAFEEILSVGYEYAKKKLLEWHESGLLYCLSPGLRPQIHTDRADSSTFAPSISPADSNDSTALIDSWLGHTRETSEAFLDLAEKVGSVDYDDVDDGSSRWHGIPPWQRSSLTMETLNSLLSRIPFTDNPQDTVASLSRAVASYFRSARHLVTTGSGLFRRRTLSESMRLSDGASSTDTSDEAGHFSDAQDLPVSISDRLNSYRNQIRPSASRTMKPQFSEVNTTYRGNNSLRGRSRQTQSVENLSYEWKQPSPFYELDGYSEDVESDADSARSSPTRLSKSSESKFRRLHRRSSLNRLRN